LQAEEVISTDTLHYRNPHTPYLGRKLRGRVVQTMLRGQTIFKNGHFVGTGRGRFLHPGSR
ncbi:MAG: allantoinase, partial [Verrucomicrobiota bacterium]|nr:allantoinase [Verrucomicrobiota bacterium]